MGSGSVATATERFKARLASAIEAVCVLEEQLEQATLRIKELETQLAEHAEAKTPPVRAAS